MSSDQEHDPNVQPASSDSDDLDHRKQSVISHGKRHSKHVHDHEKHEGETVMSDQIKSEPVTENVQVDHTQDHTHQEGNVFIQSDPVLVTATNEHQVEISNEPEAHNTVQENVENSPEVHVVQENQQPKIQQPQVNHEEEQNHQNIEQVQQQEGALNDEQKQQRKQETHQNHESEKENLHQEQLPVSHDEQANHPSQDDAAQQEPVQQNSEKVQEEHTQIATQGQQNLLTGPIETQNSDQKKEEQQSEVLLVNNEKREEHIQVTQETQTKKEQVNTPVQVEQDSEINIVRETKPLQGYQDNGVGESVISRRVLAPSIRDKPKQEQEMGKNSKTCTCNIM